MKEEILMKKSKYSDAQIMSILKQAESGVPVASQNFCVLLSNLPWLVRVRTAYCIVLRERRGKLGFNRQVP